MIKYGASRASHRWQTVKQSGKWKVVGRETFVYPLEYDEENIFREPVNSRLIVLMVVLTSPEGYLRIRVHTLFSQVLVLNWLTACRV